MKNFFGEFKKFITRGNVVDMAVGVIVGGAFTAIVNGLSNNILKPIINYVLFLVLGKDSLSEIYTFLHKEMKDVVDEAGAVIGTEIDLAQSIYIDWGAFINAIINFFLIAIVLFTIVKIFNKFREERAELQGKISKGKLTKEQVKELKKAGIKLRDKEAVKAYFEQKKLAAEQKAAEEKAAAEAAAKAEREANPTTEDLLKLILAEIKKN
ncbi:MAG: large conductance mechanosensitive channel protein MscL [Clostridia bacterium]|nr:large conductance mechanosensitive channel protein MscL [Clostridia bacterium]MBQ2255317.1 large conductance mechanosensitive channel protein MscL [Clostridia bacterium]MBQ5793481.1 large conductance mechanosensitive channel protein MscL [Clostridia bacterium]